MDLRPSKTFSDRSRTVQQSNQCAQRSNEWYPQGKNISLHIRSTGFQANREGGYSRVKIGYLKSELFHGGWGFWSEIPERVFLENFYKYLVFEESLQKPACA